MLRQCLCPEPVRRDGRGGGRPRVRQAGRGHTQGAQPGHRP